MAGQQIMESPAWRAGMPLARAQRLAARTGGTSAATPRAYLALGILSVAAIIGLGAAQGIPPAAGPADATPLPAPVAGVPAPTEEAPAPPAATIVAAADPASGLVQVAADPAEGTVQAAAGPVVIAAPAATMAGCVGAIDGRVGLLRASAGTGWSAQRDGVLELLQSALDCRDARLEIAGSLELLGSDLADLRVRWNAAERALNLAVVDRTATPPAAVAEGDAIEFVIR